MNKTELLEKIKNGEDTRSESLANEFVAFANAKGGYLIVEIYRFFGLDLATVLQNMNLSDGKHLTLAGLQ